LDGPEGVGKSTVLQQLLVVASKQGAVTIHIPDLHELLSGHQAYEFNEKSGLYEQPSYARRLLKGVLNKLDFKVLQSAKLVNSYTYNTGTRAKPSSIELQAGVNSVFDLVNAAARGKANGAIVFTDLITELTSADRTGAPIPVLFTVDNVTALAKYYLNNPYRTKEFTPVESTSFAIINTVVRLLKGELKFQHGMIVAATSAATKADLSLQVALGEKPYDPYLAYDKKFRPQVHDLFAGLQTLQVPRFTVNETGLLLQYFYDVGVIT
ncbi:mitochondrial ribosomal death-associated protein 3-domain-containing protein, partial [Lipomyces japonicus]|uniref:mitochondrial 37S ribosomal protein mS29 n=1 Tax=Lipomyces japonicus TaxID=56871 RepID=UPI0034CE9F37